MAESCAWLLVLGSVLLCSLFKMLLPTLSSLVARLLQKDGETELQMRYEIGNMKQELATISMMDEFARYARLERKINKMTDKLKTHGSFNDFPDIEILFRTRSCASTKMDGTFGEDGSFPNWSRRWGGNHMLALGLQ
ncbi:guided entry of tail-anchored proteins factor 1 isoform X2 [Rhincodon typus]|uniref:guided entry of tail-anchored proteins factor 1 isoform X2 n=1 Tax=Rhincodon typus TaxID=259920 RepID=UPI00202F6807|nr:guided entry of tail-anchored proteins factor 1 isoform X2 [Rhincodon typus]